MNKPTTRQRILDAALKLFSTAGYEGVPVKQIAGRFCLKDSAGRAFLAGMLPRMAQSARLREQNEAGPHTGGCVLFQREKEVRALL